jgi:PHD/YefM family antitoxin component YafN of YafNO toxin-antitoxin module
MPLSAVRSQLSPLLRELGPTSKPVGVTVHGKVRGYLISPEQLEQLLGSARQQALAQRRKPSARGSMRLLRPLDEAQAELQRELDEAVGRSAAELLGG